MSEELKAIMRKLCEHKGDEEETDVEPELELPEEMPVDEIPEDEPTEINIGSLVKVIDADSFTAKDLDMTDDEFEEFQDKVEAGAQAVVFNEDEDDPTLVDIVFEDGLEAFKVPKVNLEDLDLEKDAEEDEEKIEEEPIPEEEKEDEIEDIAACMYK
jgi:hypothetical protein